MATSSTRGDTRAELAGRPGYLRGERSSGNVVVRQFTRVGSRVGESSLVRSSGLLFVSNACAKLLAFGFSVVVARALHPAGLGVVTYVLTFALMGSILLYNASNGLARDVVRANQDRGQESAAFSNYIVVVNALMLSTLVVVIPIGFLTGLRGWLLVGLGACLVGNAGLEFYIELHRGREQFLAVAVFTVTANLLQLLAVVSLALLGVRDPTPYLVVYGTSTLAGILIVERFMPTRMRFALHLVNRDHVRRVVRFVLPLLVHSGLYMAWFGVDVAILRAFSGFDTVGQYGAAKTLVQAMLLAPMAIATALLPQVARLSGPDLQRYVRKLLVLTGIATAPPLLVLVLLRQPLLRYIYGPEYAGAAGALIILTIGFALYGVSMTLEEGWIATGRPQVATGLTAIAAVITVSTAPLLIMYAGAPGAATALALGAAAQLGCALALTLRYLHR
jgi:O-antigen/teichoic acid export membrane protein